MKKFLIPFSILLIGISLSTFAKIVDIKDAKLVAKNSFYEQINRMTSTSYISIAITAEFVVKHNCDPVYYVFNINGKGFIIVAADDVVEPVLGYSFETSYSIENQSPEFQAWMDTYKDQIVYAREAKLLPTSYITGSWSHLLVTGVSGLTDLKVPLDVAPMVTCNWNQDFPYNQMCPADPNCTGSKYGHTYVGCTATAMAQVMYYWRYPAIGQGYHCDFYYYNGQTLCADFDTTHYYWNGMTDSLIQECDPEALISYHAGVSVNMQYGCNGSSASAVNVPGALHNYFRYSATANYSNRYADSTSWKNKLRANLDAGEPLLYAGHDPIAGGHVWVCDGYQGTDFFHFNWGWGGYENGYFSINNINPDPYTFNLQQGAVLDIVPDPSNFPSYCSGQTNITSWEFGSLEDGSGPVHDYQNNANCSWLIAPPADSIASITLSFDKFDIDPSDNVRIYDGATTSSPLIGTYNGTAIPPNAISTGDQMLVTLTSDGSATAAGFLATYLANPVPFCQSETDLTAETGDISDGSNNYQYRNSTVCTWLIEPTDAETITLTFNTFKTEAGNDKVLVYDYVTTDLLANYSGDYPIPPPPVTCNDNKMYVKFTTNFIVRDAGWSASYSTTVGTNDIQAFNKLKIYPNPTDRLLNIGFSLKEYQNVKAELISIQGVNVFSESFVNIKGDFSKQIDLSSFAKGVYLLRLTSDRGITNRKIVIE